MDYEKKYKEALENARQEYNTTENVERKQWLEELFPELKESEDERIRNALIRFHKSTIDIDGIKGEEIIAWLEKQGEQKPFDYEHATITQKDFAPKEEPKFKVGDWIVNNYDGTVGKIARIHDDNTGFEKDYHLWTIQDAKDGDVLVDSYGNVCIYQEPSTNLMYHSRCYANNKGFYDLGGSHAISNTYPATKEQRDLLFQKMKEAGYEWNAEKKELKIVDWSKHIKYEPNSPSIIEPKQEWSEEDEEYLRRAITATKEVYPVTANWLKSLKNRVQPQPKKWSEEDEKMTNDLITGCLSSEKSYHLANSSEEITDWLKSLKDRMQGKEE